MNPPDTNPPPTPPPVTPGDRLGLTLCLAIIVHAVVILGITFSPEDDKPPRYEPLEIILVQEQSEAPDEADYLAQANLEGGGESEETERPATPIPAPFPEPVAKVAAPPPAQPQPAAPEPIEQPTEQAEPEPPQKMEQVAVETPEPAPVEQPEPQPEPPEEPAESERPEPEPVEEPEVSKDERPAKETLRQQRSTPSAAKLMSNSLEIAALSAEIQRRLKAKAERPRRKFISASTREYKYAAYMEAWRSKVERVGNLNYPEEARKRGLTGNLILDVALKPDGSVDEITIRRSSGNKILDDAAIRIVRLAAPFAPFPKEIRAETDILHITRTWQFLHGDKFR